MLTDRLLSEANLTGEADGCGDTKTEDGFGIGPLTFRHCGGMTESRSRGCGRCRQALEFMIAAPCPKSQPRTRLIARFSLSESGGRSFCSYSALPRLPAPDNNHHTCKNPLLCQLNFEVS